MLPSQARAVLHEWVQSDSLRKHCEAVGASMRHCARLQGADEDLWQAVGMLHDMDYERHPELGESGHPFVGVAWLRNQGWGGECCEEICRAILSHADYSGVERVTPMEKMLYAVDELSGFVTAVALVRPDKSIFTVEVSSVKKKLKDKGFAAKVNREDITHGAEQLGTPIESLIQDVIIALRAEAELLGLQGTPHAL